MARTKMNQRSANRVDVPMSATGGRTPPSMTSYAVLGVSIIAALWAAAMLTPAGQKGYVYVFAYTEYYVGIVSLVALSITIMVGLVATDRLVLSIRQRVLLQSAHRTTGVIAVVALLVHVWTKAAMGSIGVMDVFVPFLAPYKTMLIGFGTVSGYIMVLVMWTGIARSRFIGKGKPWMWRGIHAISYLMWPIALLHGLGAGRAAKPWVIVSYIICVLAVLVGLAVRLSVRLNRRKDFASQAGTGTGKIQPVGKLVPTTTGSIKRRGRGRRDDAVVDDLDVEAVPAWAPAPRVTGTFAETARPISVQPAGAAPISAPPESQRRPRRGVDDEERNRRRRDFDDAPTQRWEFEEDDLPAPRSRRAVDEEAPAPRQRRAVADEYFDEPTRAMSRRALDEGLAGYEDEDEVPAPRGRRRADDAYAQEPPARSRRYAGTEFEQEPPARGRRYADEEDVPAPRGRRIVEDDDVVTPRSRRMVEEQVPRARRYAAEDDEVPAPRQRHYIEDDRYGQAPVPAPRRRAGRPDDEPPRPSRSSRYADEIETAPRARRDRGADVDSADSGRHSRSEFVDPVGDPRIVVGPDLEPDETPTLVDFASRRARRASQQEPARAGSRGARRGGRARADESADDVYWRQLRGEAQ